VYYLKRKVIAEVVHLSLVQCSYNPHAA